MASASLDAERQYLDSLASQHLGKIHQYSSVVGCIPNIVNDGVFLVVTDPQGNTVYHKGTPICYNGPSIVLGFTVHLPLFMRGAVDCPFIHNGINYESWYFMPNNIEVEDAT